MKILIIGFFMLHGLMCFSQKTVVTTAKINGAIVVGYVNDAAFLNFTGPSLKLQKGQSDWMIGMLPSLRMKEDSGNTKNSLIIPSLGIGITYTYKLMAVQIPFYYSNKTTSENGRWNFGIGIGINLSQILKK
jgi:hypothetical protein